MRRAWLLALLIAQGSCTTVSRCKSGTLLVTLTLDGAAAQADQLEIAVSLGSSVPVMTTLAHRAGVAGGSVEIDFPSGYPLGRPITIDVTALQSGVAVGEDRVMTTLASGCSSATLTVSAAAAAPGDLAGLDLAGAPPVDLAGADLTGAPPPDMTCPAKTEDCFNGIDDDCDGLVDCADPDCTGGASPSATCVPDPGSFAAGVTVAASGACPSAWPTASPINAGINSTCNGAGCVGCTLTSDDGPPDSCDILMEDATNDSTCGNNTGYRVRATGACLAYTDIPNGHYHGISTPYYNGYCVPAAGNATKVTPTWTTSELFCSGARVGGGCAAGSICVPAAVNHCVMKAGSHLPCPTNYVAQAMSYYTSFDDSTRSCSCACNTIGTGGCAGSPNVSLYSVAGCSGGNVSLIPGCSTEDISGYDYAEVTGVTTTSHVSCSLGTKTTGATTLDGEQTVCCTP